MIYISTFGGFDIKYDNDDKGNIFENKEITYKSSELLKYLLTFRNKEILPETIMLNLWPESETSNTKSIFLNEVSKVILIIKSMVPKGEDEDKYLTLDFIEGYYRLKIGENTVVDVDEFDKIINQADVECLQDVKKAIDLYHSAINLYKGLYMSDSDYEVWLVPTRNYYTRLYFKTLNKLTNMLNENKEQ